MAYDRALAQRLRRLLKTEPSITERELFGGLGFFVRGNMACGVIERRLIVRVGPQAYEECLRAPGAQVFDDSGRPMRGWVTVAPRAIATPASLRAWVGRGLAFARTLPAKASPAPRGGA